MKRKKRKCVPLILSAGSGILFAVSFGLSRLPKYPSYYWRDQEIVVRSWHDIVDQLAAVLVIAAMLYTLIATVLRIAERIKSGERILGRILLLWGSCIVSCFLILLSDVNIVGLFRRADYDPAWFSFTDGQHVIVIEEESWLLFGGGTVYQIYEDDTAKVIGSISTDDGARNLGHYQIDWFERSAEITYHTFVTDTSVATKTVYFE